MCKVRSWSPRKKVAAAIVAFFAVSLLWALFVSARTPKLVQKWKGHGQMVTSVAFSPDGRFLASASYDGTVKLWRLSDGKLLQTLMHGNAPFYVSVHFVVFSPDGCLLATLDSGVITLWQVRDGKPVRTLKHYFSSSHHFEVLGRPLAFSPDGRLLASGSDDGIVRLWRISDGKLLRMLKHGGIVMPVDFSPDGRLLASGRSDGTVKLWRASDGKLVRTLKHGDWVHSLVFSPDGRLLASSGGRTVKLWRVSDGKLVRALKHDDTPHSVTFSPDGCFLASVDDAIKLWRVEDGKLVWRWKAREPILSRLARRLEPFLLTRFGIVIASELPPLPFCVAISPDGRFLAAGINEGLSSGMTVVGLGDGMIYLWRLQK